MSRDSTLWTRFAKTIDVLSAATLARSDLKDSQELPRSATHTEHFLAMAAETSDAPHQIELKNAQKNLTLSLLQEGQDVQFRIQTAGYSAQQVWSNKRALMMLTGSGVSILVHFNDVAMAIGTIAEQSVEQIVRDSIELAEL